MASSHESDHCSYDDRRSDPVVQYRHDHPHASARCHDGFFTTTADRNRACAAIAVQAPIGRVALDDLLAFVPDLRLAAEKTAKTFQD